MSTIFKGSEKFEFGMDGKIIGLKGEEVTRLAEKVVDLFDWCECYPDADLDACKTMIEEWFEQKKEADSQKFRRRNIQKLHHYCKTLGIVPS